MQNLGKIKNLRKKLRGGKHAPEIRPKGVGWLWQV